MNILNQIREAVNQIIAQLKRDAFSNERQVEDGAVKRLLHALGWDVFDVEQVHGQYSTQKGRVDYALFSDKSRRPCVSIEAKAVGKIKAESEEQLLNYAFTEGAPMLILTDGDKWHFYLTAGPGKYHERQFYKLNISEDPENGAGIFYKYLRRDAIVSGEAYKKAEAALKSMERKTAIKDAMPKVWRELLKTDDLLREMLAEATADACGYKPEMEDAAEFLYEQIGKDNAPTSPVTKSKSPPVPRTIGAESRQNKRTKIKGFRFNDKFYPSNNGADTLLQSAALFHDMDKSFLPRLAKDKEVNSENVRFVSNTRNGLFIRSPHLLELPYMGKRIPTKRGEWWMHTAHSTPKMMHLLRIQCRFANVEFNKDFQVETEEK